MISFDQAYQYINWSHGPTSDENFEHFGTLTTNLITPTLTIGLSDWWNVSFNQIIGHRYMTWDQNLISKHHRDEGSNTDYDNAIGGYLGDRSITISYLFINTGRGAGPRLFLTSGLIIPSKNMLTSDPFFVNENTIENHRHFSISQGAYKLIIENQFFVKRKLDPIFLGTSFRIEKTLNKNEFGLRASDNYILSISSYFSKLKLFKANLLTSVILNYSSEASWHDTPSPNSKSFLVIPGLGYTFNKNWGTISINLQKPFSILGELAGTPNYLNEQTDIYQITISYRRILDYTIPWLYW
tara:strand:- start:1037 stop:1930 length:894 start_codon:yes stop_codon:yes gene_type:complete